MDLHTVTTFRTAHDRADLQLGDGEQFLAGGTWLFSESQSDCTGLVDLAGLNWPDIEFPYDGYAAGGLRISATCPIATIARLGHTRDAPASWRAAPLFGQCAEALLASFKIHAVATVGGNICRAYSAAAMVSLCVALDGVAVVWTPTGGEYRVAVADLVVAEGRTSLGRGEVMRCVELPAPALRARTAFRRIALAELGRSGAVLTGRVDENGSATLTITAATSVPTVLRYPAVPTVDELRADVDAVETWYSDALGAADWRHAVSRVLLDEIREELGELAA